MVRTFNDEQMAAFEAIMQAAMQDDGPRFFFLEGSGGTGKTTLYKAAYYMLTAKGKNVRF